MIFLHLKISIALTIRALNPTVYLNPALGGARCLAYGTRWRTRGKMPRLQGAVTQSFVESPKPAKRVGTANDALKVYILLQDWDSPFVIPIEKILTCTAEGI